MVEYFLVLFCVCILKLIINFSNILFCKFLILMFKINSVGDCSSLYPHYHLSSFSPLIFAAIFSSYSLSVQFLHMGPGLLHLQASTLFYDRKPPPLLPPAMYKLSSWPR